jgi:hypothetical protein
MANAQRYLTFDDAVSIAFDANLALKSAEYDISVADYKLKAAEGLYFPKVEIVGGYMLTQRDVAIELLGSNGVINNMANTLIDNGVASGILTPDIAQFIGGLVSPLSTMDMSYIIQKRSFGVSAAKFTMPIYAGGKIRGANSVADISRRVAELRLSGAKSHLYTTLVEQYYGVVVLQYAVDVRRSVVDVMQRHLSDAKAMEEAGVKPNVKPIRGGTDGARLSFMGLPCPNIFAGGHNFHGKLEYVPVESMEKASQVMLNIIRLYAEK